MRLLHGTIIPWSIAAGITAIHVDSTLRTVLLAGAALTALIAAVASLETAWCLFILAMGSSGVTLTFAAVTLLPEHAVLVILAVHLVRLQRNSEGIAGHLTTPLLLVVAWLVINFAVSALSPHPEQSLRLALWLLSSVGAAVVAYRLVSIRPDLLILTSKVLVSYCIAGTVAWYFRLNLGFATFVEADYASAFSRAKGLMLEPNLAASFVVLGLGVAFAHKHLIANGILIAQTTVTVAFVALTVTRVAYVAILLLVAVAIVSSRRRRIPAAMAVAVVGTAVYAILNLISPTTASNDASIYAAVSERGGDFFSTSSGTGNYRLQIAETAIRELSEANLFLGYGTNAFALTHSTTTSNDGQLYLSIWWISLVYDTGLIGLAFILAAIVVFIKATRAGATLVLGMVALFAITTNPTWYAFPWVFVALAAISVRCAFNNSDEELNRARSI